MSPEKERILQRAIDTIEQSLRAQISVEELSAQAGFSQTHFCRLFESAAGLSIGRYISRRRLLHAIWAISCGTSATDAALEYGFDTHAGFYKAFRKEFGCAPSVWLRTHRAARPAKVLLKEGKDMVEKKSILQALRAWGLEHESVSSIYYANTGNKSDNAFWVGDQYVIKCSQSLGKMHRQAQLMQALHRHGLGVAVVPAKDGALVVHEAETDFLLTERQEGDPADALSIMNEPEKARAVGEGLARLHVAPKECDPSLCEEEDLEKTLREWALPAAMREMQLDADWARGYMEHFAALYPLLPKQIVHRDPNPDNMLLVGGTVAAFLDFDLSRILPRIFDIAYASTGILVDTFSRIGPEERMAFFDVAKELWRAYDAAAQLTQEEKEALPLMAVAIELICVAAFTGSEKLRQMLEENKLMLRMMLENMDRF